VTRLPLLVLPALVGLALAGTVFTALAAQVKLGAMLTGTEEVPANDSTGTGILEADYDSETNILNFTVTYDGLTGEATAAHFHGPAAPGENAPPTLPVEGDLASPISGTATLTDAQEAELLAGQWYLNLHTAQYPDGELRGQVLQTAASGEISTLPADSSMSSMDSSAMSSMDSSAMDSISSSIDVSTSVSVSVDPSVSVSASIDPSVSVPDPSVSVSASTSIDVSASVSASAP
jgi:hypothetical protein